MNINDNIIIIRCYNKHANNLTGSANILNVWACTGFTTQRFVQAITPMLTGPRPIFTSMKIQRSPKYHRTDHKVHIRGKAYKIVQRPLGKRQQELMEMLRLSTGKGYIGYIRKRIN